MPENTQEPLNFPPPSFPVGVPEYPDANSDDEDEVARQELARISLSNEELQKIAAKCGPLPKWLDEDEPPPF